MRAALLGIAIVAAAPLPAAAQALDRIEIEVSSWGMLQYRWRIEASGAARYAYADRSGASHFGQFDLVTKGFDVGREGFARIAAMTAPARAADPATLRCVRTITDAPYGTLSWTSGAAVASLGFNFGCQSDAWAPIHAGFGAALEQMVEWAKAGKEIDRQYFGPPRQ